MKVLSEAYVPNNITGGEITNMVGQVLKSHKIIFHEDELPPERLNHNLAFHIIVQFEDKFIAKVLVDGGSSLNICPLDTLKRLDKGFHEIWAGSMNVKAFDVSQRVTIGEVNLFLQMVPTWFDVEFQEVIIHGDGSNPIYTSQTIPVIGNKRRLGGETYHHIKRVNTVKKDKWWSSKIESILAWSGYEPDKGLGKNLQGITKLIRLKGHDEEDEIPEEVVRIVENFENKPKSNLDETEAVNLGDAKTVKETRISIRLSPTEEEEYIHFLREYEDIFAWSYDDMTGLSTSIVAHKLLTNPMCLPVKQKLKKFKPDMSMKINEKVTKKIKVKVLRVVEYLTWLANIVPVPKKDGKVRCAFEVSTRKLLGFIISRRGIELDPSKVKAIQKLLPPRSKKDVMSFLERLNYISRFLAQSTVICEPIFKMLRKDVETRWIEDCQKAFDKIKEYLSTPPVLVPPELGRPLLLYLSVLYGAFGCVLGQHDKTGRKEQAIYYLSKKFTPYEERTLTKHTMVGGFSLTELQTSKEWELEQFWYKESGPPRIPRFSIAAPCTGIEKRFMKIEIRYVPRIQNEFVDALATLSSMIQHPDKNFIDPIPVRIHNQLAYYAYVEEDIDGKPWFRGIKEYLAKGEYPEHANHTKKRMLRRLSNHFFHSGGNLYRRTPNLGLLRCVSTKEASKLLEEIHAGTCGPHMNGFVLAKKKLRAGYFWMTMETDCVQFILVDIDYFSKWVEAASYKVVTKKVVVDFVKDRIVCRFGVLESIVTDNVANLNRDLMKAIAFNKRVKPRQFTPGQLVLKKIFPHQDEAKGKFSPNWKGPYIVHRVLTRGEFIEMDGEIWSKPINSDTVKRYYA
ncbi:uncharacterized protein [Nicotiana sylvestris]|uniref:uncharacterized protein n=1 Tax=Nicotiana sylvestris TaxID=4096 RepID=UPI00388C3BEF